MKHACAAFRLIVAAVLLIGCRPARASAADAPGQPEGSYHWSAARHPHGWRLRLGSAVVSVTLPTETGPKTDRSPWVRIDSKAAHGVQFKADEWDSDGAAAGITFRTNRLDPAHSTMDILIAWYTGGAHCCTRVKIASLVGREWKLTDLGEWDGTPDEFPKPRIGADRAPVLPLWDGEFNYAFTAYAFSGVPLKLLRIADGRSVDVSAQPRYRAWVLQDMAKWRKLCTDPRQEYRNGFCAAFAADAARAGRLDAAWPVVLQNSMDEAMSFCRRHVGGDCKDEVKFDHYADALRWFLREHDYIRQ